MLRKRRLLSKYAVVLIERPSSIGRTIETHVWIRKDYYKLIKLGLALCNRYDKGALNTVNLPKNFLYIGFFELPYDTHKLVYFIDEASIYERGYLYISAYNDRVLGELE